MTASAATHATNNVLIVLENIRSRSARTIRCWGQRADCCVGGRLRGHDENTS
jgi:hypothetical protein